MTTTDSREVDLEVLSRLESAYCALSLAVQDPVVITNPDYDPIKHRNLPIDISHVYFYVEDDKGLEIVRDRIRSAEGDIRESIRRHDKMCSVFRLIEEACVEKNRERAANRIAELCNNMTDYGEFVLRHRERDNDFLQFPNYTGGNISYRARKVASALVLSSSGGIIDADFRARTVDQSVRQLEPFNEGGEYVCFMNCVGELRGLSVSFRDSRGPLWGEIYTGHPEHSYDRCIELTKMLLREHLGFDAD